jgi:asparagine synthase (glutamine-hydrolysing)
MSSICGFFNRDGKPASVDSGSLMMKKMSIHNLDYADVWYYNEFFMGCNHQIITPESMNEKLPMYDYNSGLSITADAIIDNREELFKVFGIPLSERYSITDSQLILMSYKKWGEKCPVHLIGDYAFVIADLEKRQLFCARDHVGKRTFYYAYNEGVFAFSTLMKPLFAVNGFVNKLNELWIADFLSIPTVLHELDENHTIYENIMQLAPAHALIVDRAGIRKHKYWDPFNLPEIRFKSDDDYDDAFRDVFFEAVRCRTRSNKPIGVMLSGGLDSGAVACVVAGILNKRGENLKAFTALPMDGYKDFLSTGYIADESSYIEAIKEQYSNIELNYSRSEGKHSLKDIDKFLGIFEQPYKIVQNLFWLDDIAELASKNGCNVLLDGQYGNSTISFGDFYTQAFTLFKSGRIISLYREIKGFSRLHRVSGKKCAKHFIKQFLSDHINMSKKGDMVENTLSIISMSLASEYETSKRLRRAGYRNKHNRKCSLNDIRKLNLRPYVLTHLGAIETKLSLYHGIVKRDPTRDKRVIDFCFKIPGNQFVYNGQERVLIRRSMKGIIPDKVRLNMKEKGIQSADWMQRLSPFWGDIRNEFIDILAIDKLQKYVYNEKVMEELIEVNELVSGKINDQDLRLLLSCFIFAYFIKSI